MNTLLAILLYMQLIQSPGTYNRAYIDQLEMQNHAQIQMILNDPIQMQDVNSTYLLQVPNIVILIPEEVRLPKTSGYFMCVTDYTLPGKYQ
ncbi:MAG: hypothetical protein EOP47_16100 [Sphingobacteriaceae bacterium]|nr:MAG: hypothetical protein EOP47_16100 [Sphingobacteriaceae bacterium]